MKNDLLSVMPDAAQAQRVAAERDALTALLTGGVYVPTRFDGEATFAAAS